MTEKERLTEKIQEITGWDINTACLKIVSDTSDWMSISRGDVIKLTLCHSEFVVRGYMTEPRFGIDEQAKYWVFHAICLDTNTEKIIKTVFQEEFYTHIGKFKFRCYRDNIKEADVLQLVKGDTRFMQGDGYNDSVGNKVRVIDYIKGKSFFSYIQNIEKSHEQYFYEDLPIILWNLLDSIEAIHYLHENGFCHGDIRNDHIFIESDSRQFRWIDFDLTQDDTDFDMWSIGNILSYAVAKGIITFKQAVKSDDFSDEIVSSLTNEDGSAFYNNRIMNLSKLFPYIPEKISKLLQHFTIKSKVFYSGMDKFYEDYTNMLETEFTSGKNKKV